jgi:hypothetical protein
MRHRPFLHHYLQAKLRHHQAKQRRPIFSGRCAKTSHETDHSTLFALPALHDSPTALHEQDQRMRSIIPDLRNLSYTRRLNPSLCAPSPSTRWSVTPHECQRQLPFAAHRYSKRAVWSLMTCMNILWPLHSPHRAVGRNRWTDAEQGMTRAPGLHPTAHPIAS